MRTLNEIMDRNIMDLMICKLEQMIAREYDHSKYDQIQEFVYEIDYKVFENKTLYSKFKKELLKAGYRIKSEETVIVTSPSPSYHIAFDNGNHISTLETKEEKKLRITITTAPYVEKKKRKPVKPPKAIATETEVAEEPVETPHEEKKEAEA